MLIKKIAKKGIDFLGVEYPIICGGMTWVSDFKLIKSVSDNGGFGVLAGGNTKTEIFEKQIDECIEKIKTPFGVNLVTIAPRYKEQYEMLLSKKIPIIIFAGSFPRKRDIEKMKASGKKTLSFASTNSIASQQIRFGIDGLILEGSEAGGHIGHVSLIILLQQVLFNFKSIPIFVAGGIATGKMIAHLLLMGASGCQLGTKFVLSEECSAHPNFKQAFLKAKARQAIATPQYDSKLPVVSVRAIKNKAMEKFGKLQLELLKKLENNEIYIQKAQYEVEKFWMGALKKAAMDGDVENGSLMSGQSVGLANDILPMKKIMENLINEAEDELNLIKNKLANL